MKKGDKVRPGKSTMLTFAQWRRQERLIQESKKLKKKMTGFVKEINGNTITVVFPQWDGKEEQFLKCDLDIVEGSQD